MKLLGRKAVYSGWSSMFVLDVALADGRRAVRQLEDHGQAAAVLAYDPARRTALLVRQPRVALLASNLDGMLLEAAAGLIDPGETAEIAARREAQEELGVSLSGPLELVAPAWSIPSLSTERVSLFLAVYDEKDRVSAGGGEAEEGEEIEVVEIPLKTLLADVDVGHITDMKTLVLVLTLARRQPDLFA
jgi:nudix-type nucleoside diphosphatase (YffH/AdpP family)